MTKKDLADPLAAFRDYFYHPKDTIYLDGNSLGKLPLGTAESLQEVVLKQWGQNLIASWNKDWLALPHELAKQMSHLLNGLPEEIIIGESTSVRLFQITQALVNSQQFPKTLLTDQLNFPTDLYILDQIAMQSLGKKAVVISYQSELEADLEQLKDSLGKTPGIYCLSLVTYKSGFLYPMLELNRLAKESGSIIIWDLSHAVGVVDIDLKATETRVALGCTYKYLNGGPGAPAFLYVDKTLMSTLENPIAGWFGHAKPFDFSLEYEAHNTINKMAVGTPPILSLVALQKGLSICLAAGTKALQEKSRIQTQWLFEQIELRLIPYGVTLESPRDANQRGAHISIAHLEAWRITQALQAASPQIIPDYRPDKYIRLGLAPLYTRYSDLQTTVDILEDILKDKSYLNFSHQKATVT